MVKIRITKDKEKRIKIPLPARIRDELEERGVYLESGDCVDVKIRGKKIVIEKVEKNDGHVKNT